LKFFSENMKAGPKQDRQTRIKSISISGNAANAHLEIEYPTFTFQDYMHLLKIDGEWKIVSKIFYRQDKKSAIASNNQNTTTSNTSQQGSSNSDGIPSLDDIVNGTSSNNGSTSNTGTSTSTTKRTLGKWKFAVNGVEGNIEMYQQQNRAFNRISYRTGQVHEEELYQNGNRIMVKNSQRGEYYVLRQDGNLDAYTKDGYVTTCRLVR